MKKKTKYSLIIATIIVVLAIIINANLINPNIIQVRREVYQDKLVSKDLDGLNIAFFTDLHYGSNIDGDKFNDIIGLINQMDPDIVIFGGDLIKENYEISDEEINFLIEGLKSLSDNYGKFAVLGDIDEETNTNHNLAKEILNQANFEILDNKHVTIHINHGELNLVGIENLITANPKVSSAFENVKENKLTIAISHTPDIVNEVSGHNPQIMLSGHSMGGEIYIPYITSFFMNEGSKNYYHGKKMVNNTLLDISNGLASLKGTRLLADAEIVIYELKAN